MKAIVPILVFMLLGCSNGEPAKTEAKPVKKSAAAKADIGETNVEAPARKSVFAIDKTYRDPFFPKRQPFPAEVAPTQASTLPVQVISLLENAYQGVIGTANHRIAMINNTILEPNKTVVISLKVGSQTQNIPVHCIDVLKNGVLIEIPGQAAPITISRPEFNN